MENYKVPFYRGNMQSYPFFDDEWRDVYEFEDTLTYLGYGRGLSSVNIELQGSNGVRYVMFISDFDDIFRKLGGFDGISIKGRWTFVKKGQNYGIKAVL